MSKSLPAVVEEWGAALLHLAATISEASEAQWQPSHRPSPREDTTERAKGGHGDPTLATVVDDTRLDLRDRVAEAERVLLSAASWTRDVDAKLTRALDAWAGDRAL